MAIKLFKLGFLIKAIDAFTAPMRKVHEQMALMNAAAERVQPLKEWGAKFAEVGAIAGGAGLAIGLGLKHAVEAADQLEDHMNRLNVAMGNVSNKAALMAQAHEFVAKQAIATGYDVGQLTESLYQGVSGFLNLQQAMAVSTEAAKLARATQGDLADTTSALATMMLNFGDATKTPIQNATILADKMAALQTQFKFKDLTELTSAMKEAAPAAMGLGVNLNQMFGALATLSAGGLTGETAGTAFLEIMTQLTKASKKLGFEVFAGAGGKGIDLLRTLDGIRNRFGDIAQNKEVAAQFEKAFGARAGTRIAILLQHLDRFHQAMDGVNRSAGTVDRAFAVFNEKGSMVFERLHQAITTIEISLGEALLPYVEKIARGFLKLATWIQGVTAAHPQWVKFIAVFAGISATVLLAVGAIGILAGGLAFLGAVVAPVGAALGISVSALALFSAGATAAAAAIVAWWPQISAFFSSLTSGVAAAIKKLWELIKPENLFGNLIPEMFAAGVKLVEALAKGIWHVASLPGEAVASIAHKIMSFLPHSPADQGPLRQLSRIRIVETIAETIRPAPIVSAMSNVAAAAMLAAPIMLRPMVPAFAAPSPAMLAPVRSSGVAGAPASSGRGGDIVIHYSPNITVNGGSGSPEEWRKEMRRHGDELVRLIEDRLARQRRLRFE